MGRAICVCFFALALSVGAVAEDLSTAPATDLLKVYNQLRDLRVGSQQAVTEKVVWKRDAASFIFVDGTLTFAAPVAGRVLAAVFVGHGKISLSPPTSIEQRQLARFTGSDELGDEFREAVFFFTDDSWEGLQKLVKIQPGGDTQTTSKLLASAQKRYQEDFNGWWSNRRQGNPVMRNLAARMLADLTDPTSRGFFLADFKGERSGNLLYQISWNRDSLVLPEFSNDEEVSLIHYKLNEYTEWWGGFHPAEEYARNPRPEHRALLAHCSKEQLDAEIASDNRLSATATMDYTVANSPVRVLPLNLEGVLRIDSVQDGEGRKLAFIQEERNRDSDPWIILPEPVVPSKTYQLKISYSEDSTRDSRIVFQQGSGLYYVTARESWFPSFGAFDDRSQYVLHMRSPKKFKFVSTGRLMRSEKEKDFLETTWESPIPLGVVGFNYGDFVNKSRSDANLTVTAYSGKEVPDELKNLGAAIDMAELGRGPNRSGSLEMQMGIMRGGFNTAIMVGYAAGVSYQALKLFESYYGGLPFPEVSVTEQPVRGYGQSWPMLIFLPYDSLLDGTTRNSLRLQNSAEAREFYNLVAVHEMAHQWWGHTVGWKTYHDQWLSEGFAEFSAALFLRQFEPKNVKSFWDLKRRWLLSKNRAGHRPVDVAPVWLGLRSNSYMEPGNYQALVYFKGAYILEMLRVLMEDLRSPNPNAKFIAMMKDFVSTYSGKNASTEDFRRIVNRHCGESMDWFIDEWVYGTATPHYGLNYSLQQGDNGKTILQISVTQSDVPKDFRMRVPIYVTIDGQPRRLGFVSVEGTTAVKANIPLPMRPQKVTLDEYHSILCTVSE
ncbi:MAG: hypothetical protein LAP13_27000 [Acidobacteriia bacterium]|nr:hypothetical protein [Terriglobia bacterium]